MWCNGKVQGSAQAVRWKASACEAPSHPCQRFVAGMAVERESILDSPRCIVEQEKIERLRPQPEAEYREPPNRLRGQSAMFGDPRHAGMAVVLSRLEVRRASERQQLRGVVQRLPGPDE
jgi:hypothetical protein